MSVSVNVVSFKKGFPKDMPAPERLLAFAAWVEEEGERERQTWEAAGGLRRARSCALG